MILTLIWMTVSHSLIQCTLSSSIQGGTFLYQLCATVAAIAVVAAAAAAVISTDSSTSDSNKLQCYCRDCATQTM
jgi:hypothetical protein